MLKKIKSFLENSSGSILPTMGILTIPLAITAGAAVDYTRYVNMRNDVQTAIDAAGIASVVELTNIKSSIPSNITGDAFNTRVQQELQTYADNFLKANITSDVAVGNYTFNINYIPATRSTDGGVELTADITYDTIFGGVNGSDGGVLLFKDKITDSLTSIITNGNRTVEIALVMDNSGSMGTYSGGKSRLNRMKEASVTLVDDLYDSARNSPLPDPIQFSLVPFSATVNIGGTGHDNLDGDFLDTRGFNPTNNENLDWKNTYKTNKNIKTPGNRHVIKVNGNFKSRLDAFDMIGATWGGCVEMRPWPHNTLDTYVKNQGGYNKVNNKMDADGDGKKDGSSALFVPYFAPDEPDPRHADFYKSGHTDSRDLIDNVDHNPDHTSRYDNNYLYDFQDADFNQYYTGQDPSNTAYGKKGSTYQVDRTNWLFKYQRNLKYKNWNFSSTWGPNDGCRTKPITALTPERQDVVDAINEMSAGGTTNIQQGLTWGWRSLSPGLPLDQGRRKDDPINLKFIILLTDGNNFYSSNNNTPNRTNYGAWGYMRPDTHHLKHAITDEPIHNRLADGMSASDLTNTIYAGQNFDLTPDSSWDLTRLMNAHTAQSCENVKADGVSIYTIVYDLTDQNTLDLMEACAGSGVIDGDAVIAGVEFFHRAQGANLDDTFAEIASSITAIRIAK